MSMALLLLGLIVLACVLGGVIPQGARAESYVALYGQTKAGLISFTGLDRVFTAWWFIALVALLMVNLCLCSLLRFPSTLRAYREGFSLDRRLKQGGAQFEHMLRPEQAEPFARQMGFRRLQSAEREGLSYRYAARRRLGLWGSWLSHLGMLVIVLGFALGQLLHFDSSVYGVPGQTLRVPGTPLSVRIDDFQILLRPDDTVEQYIADLTVTSDEGGQPVSGQAMVNAPLRAFGRDFLQNATGWAVTAQSFQGDRLLDSRVLCAGESLELSKLDDQHMDLALVFQAFFPDYVRDRAGPRTRSPHLKNPAALFSLYYEGRLVDQNVAGMGYDIKVGDYRFVLSEPQPYTLIQIVSDPALPIAASGGLLMLIGLFLAFYLRPEELWMLVQDGRLTVWGRSAKGAALFEDRAALIAKEMEKAT